MKQDKLKPGQLLVPRDHETLIAIPPWVKRNEDEQLSNNVPILGQGSFKRKPTKNQLKSARVKTRQAGQRKSGRTKCRENAAEQKRRERREQEEAANAPTVEQQIVLTKADLQIEQNHLIELQRRIGSTTVRGERFILKLDIEKSEERIEQLTQHLMKLSATHSVELTA
ncbi:MAG: hypothetical protein V1738_04850 [Patescibacteria group bacterium]